MNVEEFIEKFNKVYNWSQFFFLNGGCKIFATILANNFHWEVLDYLWHYVTKIDWNFYDITWKISVEEKRCNKEWDCKSIDECMNSYKNIFEIVLNAKI